MSPQVLVVPFEARFADELWAIAFSEPGQRAAAAVSAILEATVDAKHLAYWKSADLDDRAIAQQWHRLRSGLRDLAAGRPRAWGRIGRQFDGYIELQREAAARSLRIEAQKVAAVAAQDSSEESAFRLEQVQYEQVLLIAEGNLTPEALLTSAQPPSKMQPIATALTVDFHVTASDRAVVARALAESAADAVSCRSASDRGL